jgi:hypothetical protein
MITPTPPTKPGNQGAGTKPATTQPLPFPAPGATQRATTWSDHARAAVTAIMGERNDVPTGPRVDLSELGQTVSEVVHLPIGMLGVAVATPMWPVPPGSRPVPSSSSTASPDMTAQGMHWGVSQPRSYTGNSIGLSDQLRRAGLPPSPATQYVPPRSLNGVGSSDPARQ